METGRNFTNSSVFQSKKIKLNFSKFKILNLFINENPKNRHYFFVF